MLKLRDEFFFQKESMSLLGPSNIVFVGRKFPLGIQFPQNWYLSPPQKWILLLYLLLYGNFTGLWLYGEWENVQNIVLTPFKWWLKIIKDGSRFLENKKAMFPHEELTIQKWRHLCRSDPNNPIWTIRDNHDKDGSCFLENKKATFPHEELKIQKMAMKTNYPK